MCLTKAVIRAPAVVAAGALLVALALQLGPARAQDKSQDKAQGETYEMKISTPTIHDIPDTWADRFGAAVEKDSGGRIKAHVYPASQLGSIPRQIEGTQFGSIQMEVVPPEFMVGLDQRFQVMAAPGLVNSQVHGQRVAADPAVLKLMLGLGANKGLHGVGLFMAEQAAVVSRMPLRHLADFEGKKIRIFASQFQSAAFERLGVTPVAMSLGANFHMADAAKYVTETGQPAIFIIAEVNKSWFDSLPKDLQQLIEKDAKAQSLAINTFAAQSVKDSEASYAAAGGELIKLPPDEQAKMMKIISSVAPDVTKTDPALAAAYKIVADAAERTQQTPSQ